MAVGLRCAIGLALVLCLVPCRLNGNLIELCEQLDFYNHLSLLQCLRFASYGCWCGPGGSGKPVDGIDNCCMHHDKCYDHARVSSHDRCLGYIDIYKSESGKCFDPPGSCDRELCTCDVTIAKCISNFKYDTKYEFWRFHGRCKNTTVDRRELRAYSQLEEATISLYEENPSLLKDHGRK